MKLTNTSTELFRSNSNYVTVKLALKIIYTDIYYKTQLVSLILLKAAISIVEKPSQEELQEGAISFLTVNLTITQYELMVGHVGQN